MAAEKGIDAFISYSHSTVAEVARGLQTWLQRYAKPWWLWRALAVFRDETDLSAAPDAWSLIATALERSKWLILVATPEAAASKWVKRETRFWLSGAARSSVPFGDLDERISAISPGRAERFLIVLGAGDIVWNDQIGDFDWAKTNALPKCLAGVFSTEPLWVDLRPVVASRDLRQGLGKGNPLFIEAVARLSARIRGLDLAWLIGEEARQHRRAMTLARGAVSAISGLAVAAGIAAWLASVDAAAADKQRRIADAQAQAAAAESLLAREPSQIATAGAIANKAYAEMRSLSALRIAPTWLTSLLGFAQSRGFNVLSSIRDSDAFLASARDTGPAIEVIDAAHRLVPRLVGREQGAPSVAPDPGAFLEGDLIVHSSGLVRINVWRPSSGALRPREVEAPASRINGWANQTLSGDGKVFAQETVDGLVRIRSLPDGAVLRTIDPHAFFAAADFDKPAPPPEPSGAQRVETFRAGSIGAASLSGLALDENGRRLLIITKGGRAGLINLSDPPLLAGPTWIFPRTEITSIDRLSAIRLSGSRVAAATSSFVFGRAPVVVLNAIDGTAPFVALIHDAGVNDIAFSPDGKVIATATDDGGVTVWSAENGTKRRALHVKGAARSTAFGSAAAEGFLLVGDGEGVAYVFAVETGEEIARAPHPGRVDAVFWSPSGVQFATAASQIGSAKGDAIRVWSLEESLPATAARMHTRNSMDQIALDGGKLAAIVYPFGLTVWDEASGSLLRDFGDVDAMRLPIALDAEEGTVTAVPAKGQGLAYVFDIRTGAQRIVPGPGVSVSYVSASEAFLSQAAFDVAGRTMARLVKGGGARACHIEIWNLADSRQLRDFPCESPSAIALDPQGRELAVIEDGETAQLAIWDTETGGQRWTKALAFKASHKVGTLLAFSGDGNRLVAAGGKDAVILATVDGAPTGASFDFDTEPFNVALDIGGKRVAVALDNKTVIIADVASGVQIRTLPFASDVVGGGGLVFSGDGQRVIATFGDSNVNNPRIWKWFADPEALAKGQSLHLAPIVAVDGMAEN